jgi:hypothetical protein
VTKPSVLVLIPIKPSLHPALADRCAALARRMMPACPDLELTIMLDGRKVEHLDSDCRPWSKVTRIRNRMLDLVGMWPMGTLVPRHFQPPHEWILWIDADVVDYPADLAQWLIHGAMTYANNGVCAPTVIIEESETFYDWSAYIYRGKGHIEPENRNYLPGRNISCAPPYYAQGNPPPSDYTIGDFVEMDGVGTCYAVHRDIYLEGTRHDDHPAFTDHWPICAKAWDMGRKVVALPNVVIAHANLPRYGENWH